MKADTLVLLFKAECDIIINRNQRKIITKEYAKACLDGIYQVFSRLVWEFDMNKAFKSKKPTREQKKKYAPYENISIQLMRIFTIEGYGEIAIFNDDYGQCFAALICDELHGLGTYNLDICPEVYHLILNDLLDRFQKELI